MAVFSYTWRTEATTPPQCGEITVRDDDPVRALLFARRFVRDTRLQGLDLARVQLEERADHERRSEKE